MNYFILLLLVIASTESTFGQIATDSSSTDVVSSPAALTPSCEAYVPEWQRRTQHPKSLYIELGGSGGFGSFNYESTFGEGYVSRWMFRAGISGTFIDKNNGAVFIFPVMIHWVYGKNHGLDLGIGQALSITTRGKLFLRTPLSIGYRLEPESSRFFYRVSYTPIVSYLVDFQWEHWGGISIGYKLKLTRKFKG